MSAECRECGTDFVVDDVGQWFCESCQLRERIAELERQLKRHEQIDHAEVEARATDKVRIAALEAIVEKLPKDGDDKPVAPGTSLWGIHPRSGQIYMWGVALAVSDTKACVTGGGIFQRCDQFYSTRAAAETAAKEGAGT